MKGIGKKAGKGLGLLLVLVLVLSQSIPLPVLADPPSAETVFKVESASVLPGDSVSLRVDLEDCQAFHSLGLKIIFDPSVFELTGLALHEDRVTDDPHSLLDASLLFGTFRIEKDGSGDMTFSDGPLLLMTFKVLEDAVAYDYPIKLEISDDLWLNSQEEELEASFEPGLVTVEAITGQALYEGVQYDTVREAFDEAASAGDQATVRLLKDLTIEDPDEGLKVPDGADIIFDMRGKTIAADFEGDFLIEVEAGGRLELTSTGVEPGKFLYPDTKRPVYLYGQSGPLSFLLNEGELSMSRIQVTNFWYGIVDGLFEDPWTFSSGTGGSIDALEDLALDTVFTALGLGGSQVGCIQGCQLVADTMPVLLGIRNTETKKTGSLGLLQTSSILSRRAGDYSYDIRSDGCLFVGWGWEVEEIRDTVIGSHEEAALPPSAWVDFGFAMANMGWIGKITSSSGQQLTRIEDPLFALVNGGWIGLIEGEHTRLVSQGVAVFNTVADPVLGAGEIKKISGGHFISTDDYALIGTGGIFDEISGGHFWGKKGALAEDPEDSYGKLTGGYYKTEPGGTLLCQGALGAIPLSEGYGISTLPLLLEEHAGYYHIGPAFEISWKFDQDPSLDRDDTFILDDPVYYPLEIEDQAGIPFLGWLDLASQSFYAPEDLPAASADRVYQAVFDQTGGDPVITTGSASVLPGFEVTLPVTIENCPPFNSLNLEILFDDDYFDLTGVDLHPDRKPDSGHSLVLDAQAPLGGSLTLVKDQAGDMIFQDGPFLLLTFKAKEGTPAGQYPVNLKLGEAIWKNSEGEDLEGIFQAGAITVEAITGEALYAGTQYSKVKAALEEAAQGGPDARVYILKDILIDDPDYEGLVIPDQADIILDMRGWTLTADYEGDFLIEIEAGGRLSLTSSAGKKGQFVYGSRPDYADDQAAGLSFLLNAGELDMYRIEVRHFWQGVVDPLFPRTWQDLMDDESEAEGTIGLIEDCVFDTVYSALAFGRSVIGVIRDSEITADAMPVSLGHQYYWWSSPGSVDAIDGCSIRSRRVGSYTEEETHFGGLLVGPDWSLGLLQDTSIDNHEEAEGLPDDAYDLVSVTLLNVGWIGRITSSSDTLFTLIEDPMIGLANLGIIGLIDGSLTEIGGAMVGILNMGVDGDPQYPGEITEIADGQTWGGGVALMNGLDGSPGWVGKISGGTFIAEIIAVLANGGSIGDIRGGRFHGIYAALFSYNEEGKTPFNSITGGYYRADEIDEEEEELIIMGHEALEAIAPGYALSTNPLPEGDEHEAYYHVGPAVKISWVFMDQPDLNREDIFILGDPVYYPFEVEVPQGKFFKGWFDGNQIHEPDKLPLAQADTLYLAIFGDLGSEEKPFILVGSGNGMAGDSFSIPVVIEDCPAFQAMGLELSFDKDAFVLKEVALHPDRVADSDHSLDVDLGEGLLVISKEDSGDMAFEDGPFLLLTLEAAVDAQSGVYLIELAISEALWKNSDDEELEGTLVPGLIQLLAHDDDYEAFYAGSYYLKVKGAIEAASSGGPDAKVIVLKDIAIEDQDDRLVIPEGADICLDMRGRTITAAFDDQPLVHVQEGGKLTLTSTAQGRGRFVYHERPLYEYLDEADGGPPFLINEGTLDMNRIEIEDFWQGVIDGLAVKYWYSTSELAPSGSGGQIGQIEDCVFDTVTMALGLGGSTVGTILDCRLVADSAPLALGHLWYAKPGSLETLENSVIVSRGQRSKVLHSLEFQGLFVGAQWTLGLIRDTRFERHENHPPPQGTDILGAGTGLLNYGSIGLITSSSSQDFTLLEGYTYALMNFGSIGLIDGADTRLHGLLIAIFNNADILWGGPEGEDFKSQGTITEIREGYFEGPWMAIINSLENDGAKATIDLISGGTFVADLELGKSALCNYSVVGKITGGRFIGGAAWALEADEDYQYGSQIAQYKEISGGYYMVGEGGDLLSEKALAAIPEGYALSTNPLPAGEENEGFYQLGPAYTITWKVMGQDDRVDKFIAGSQVYYPLALLEPPGHSFLGWTDGSANYGPSDLLPAASKDVTYTALFDLSMDVEIVLTKNDVYRGLPDGYQLVEVRIPTALPQGQAFVIDGDLIFYSPFYSQKDDKCNPQGKAVYVYAVDADFDEEDVLDLLALAGGESESLDEPLGGIHNVNGDGRVNSTDVILTYALYKGLHWKKTLDEKPTLSMRLRADTNGDRTVDTGDAQTILDYIWGP